MLFRLLSDPDKNIRSAPRFWDINNSEWFAKEVNYMASKGYIEGYPEGDFRPDNPITRAEFATMISRFDDIVNSGENMFVDIETHWAWLYINNVAERGWVSGFGKGIFGPDINITRAQVVKIINRMLHREIDIKDIPGWARTFIDVSDDYWAFTDIVEASNGHEYVRNEDGFTEHWVNWLDWDSVPDS